MRITGARLLACTAAVLAMLGSSLVAQGPGGFGQGRGGGAPQGPQADPNAPVLDYQLYINPRGGVEEDYPLHAHTRDFLDKMKAKDRKTAAPMEVGYNSALPALLALEAMKENKVLGWDPVARKSKAL